ncbi:unnamed protein product [Diamesa tonsa]
MILQDPLNLRVLRCTAAQPSLQVFKVKRKLPMTKVMKQFCKLSGLKFENIRFFSDAHGLSEIPFYKADRTAVRVGDLDLRHNDTIIVTNKIENGQQALSRVKVSLVEGKFKRVISIPKNS